MRHKDTNVALAGQDVTSVRRHPGWLSRAARSLGVKNPWIGIILISVVCCAACATHNDSERNTVDGAGDAPLSGNGSEVSTTAATVLDGQATQPTSDPARDRAEVTQTEDEAEEALTGTWTGTGQQPSVNSSWSIEIAFEVDGVDIRYPSLACGGQLQPVSGSEARFVYRERIRFGLSQCIDNGRVVLERTSEDTLSYEWYDESGILDATGSLTQTRE